MVIDTHVLYWWLDGIPQLSKTARDSIEQASEQGVCLIISAVSLWELAHKEKNGKFSSRQPVADWPKFLRGIGWNKIIDTDADLWLAAAALDWPHRDPADRIIAATALRHGVPVLTKDRVFHESGCPVRAVW